MHFYELRQFLWLMKDALLNSNIIRIVDNNRFIELCDKGEIVHNGCTFLDGFKIALHANMIALKAPDFIDSNDIIEDEWKPLNLNENILNNGNFYLAVSNEKICISKRLMGLIQTRSYWARMGLDCIGSSYYVGPGFGNNNPTSMTLELRPRVNIKLTTEKAFASLILFEFANPVQQGSVDHYKRFPLNLNIYNNDKG